jgi:hypothetical protein
MTGPADAGIYGTDALSVVFWRLGYADCWGSGSAHPGHCFLLALLAASHASYELRSFLPALEPLRLLNQRCGSTLLVSSPARLRE